MNVGARYNAQIHYRLLCSKAPRENLSNKPLFLALATNASCVSSQTITVIFILVFVFASNDISCHVDVDGIDGTCGVPRAPVSCEPSGSQGVAQDRRTARRASSGVARE